MPKLVAVIILVLGMLALGILDVSVVVLRDGSRLLCNGFFCLPADQAYHVALYLVYGSFWGLVFMALRRRGET